MKQLHLPLDVFRCDNIVLVVSGLQSVTIIDPINYTILVAILYSVIKVHYYFPLNHDGEGRLGSQRE